MTSLPLICFDALWNALHPDKKIPQRASGRTESRALFVTWNILSGGEYDLRGCIGTFSPVPLDDGLTDYALISALKDTRFLPITARELPLLQCEVSVLHSFEICSDYLDWSVGVHGIYVEVYNPPRDPPTPLSLPSSPSPTYATLTDVPSWDTPHATYTATFLPHVMPEQGWDATEAVVHCIRKAGLRRTWSPSQLKACVRVVRYQSDISHEEFRDWAKGVGL